MMYFIFYFVILSLNVMNKPAMFVFMLCSRAMFHLFNDKSILLSKMRCTDYLLFQEKTEISPIQP